MVNKGYQTGAAGGTSLGGILHEMNEVGSFQASVLTSSEGLPIITVPDSYDGETLSAVLAFLHKTCRDIQGEVGMAAVDEVTIRDDDSVRLVSRCFTAGGQGLILAAVVPAGHYYRRATNRAIKRIQALLSPL